MNGNFVGNIPTEDEDTSLNTLDREQIIAKFQEEIEEENKSPRLKVEINTEDIDNKVNCVKDILKSNPNSTIRSIRKALLDTGFKLTSEDEIKKIVEEANPVKYIELYQIPIVPTQSTHKSRSDVPSEQHQFLIEHRESTPKELLKPFKKQFKTSKTDRELIRFFKDQLYKIRKSFNKNRAVNKDYKLSSEQKDFLIINKDCDDTTLLNMFNKKFQKDTRKLGMITTFFKSGGGKNTKREIKYIATPIKKIQSKPDKPISEINVITDILNSGDPVSQSEMAFFIDNQHKSFKDLEVIYRKTYINSNRSFSAICTLRGRAREETSVAIPVKKSITKTARQPIATHPKTTTPHHIPVIQVNNHHILKQAIDSLYKSGKSPALFSQIKPVIELIEDPNEVAFAIECLTS